MAACSRVVPCRVTAYPPTARRAYANGLAGYEVGICRENSSVPLSLQVMVSF